MILLYTGRRGSGKTLSMVKDAFKFYNSGWQIFSNIDLKFNHEYINESDILKINEDSKIQNCVLVVDEIQVLLDSRRSMSNTNVDFSHFIQQIRKRNIIVLCTTQFSGTVDLRVRQHVDIEAKPRFNEKYNVCEITYIDLTVADEWDLYDEKPPSVKLVYNCKPIYELYNTYNIVSVEKKKKKKGKGRKNQK